MIASVSPPMIASETFGFAEENGETENGDAELTAVESAIDTASASALALAILVMPFPLTP
jgi:hypothetical protein